MNLSTATLIRPMAGGPRNGLPGRRDYVYRGTDGPDTLTPEIDAIPLSRFRVDNSRQLAPCGTDAAYRRHLRKGEPVDEECRAANTRKVTDYKRKRREREAS